jgi:hypothetical protein
MNGWIVKASIPTPEGLRPLVSRFHVAVEGREEAVKAARSYIGDCDGIEVLATKRLPWGVIESQGMKCGEVRPIA